jgi:hypothetical protein
LRRVVPERAKGVRTPATMATRRPGDPKEGMLKDTGSGSGVGLEAGERQRE